MVGEDETAEFVAQSQAYAKKLQDSESLDEYLLLEGKNHYTVSRLLSSSNNLLMTRILGMCGALSD
ncbi:hypothetical protein [Thalassomonas haliotis]|uniref:Uncharacterized protein n=1 Tax=Thalassomonas haliotis TaxID=485448 RepID=A0ABY7VLE2_9GAMM|nr:hypothetical protein [Thalassomonas haliotis]WDE14017.1 hypothetical protein H3N35_11575 [Thalassomonas haliotis]